MSDEKEVKTTKKKAQHVPVHVLFFPPTTTYCTGNIAPYKALHYDTLFEAELVLIIIIDMNHSPHLLPCCKNKIRYFLNIFYWPALTLQTCSANRKSLRWDAPSPPPPLSSISTVFLYVCLPSSGKLWFRWHQGPVWCFARQTERLCVSSESKVLGWVLI